MTQRFGGIFSILPMRDYQKIVEIWYKSEDYGVGLAEEFDNDETIQRLETMSSGEILRLVTSLKEGIAGQITAIREDLDITTSDLEVLMDLRTMNSELQRIERRLQAKLR